MRYVLEVRFENVKAISGSRYPGLLFDAKVLSSPAEFQGCNLRATATNLVFADGKVHEFEDNLIWRTAELLGVSSEVRIRLKQAARDVKLVISDSHEGIKAAVSKVLSATWQRCRVHFMRNALAHAGRSGRRVVSAFSAS